MLIFRSHFCSKCEKPPTTDLPRLAEEKSKPLGEKEVDQQTAKNLEELVWWSVMRPLTFSVMWCQMQPWCFCHCVFLMGKGNPSKKFWIQVGDENSWDQGMISGATREVRIGSIRNISFYANKGSIVNLLSLESNPSCKCYMMLERDYGQLNQRDALLGKQIAPFWILFDSHYTYP